MKRILIALLILMAGGGLYGLYLYQKKPADIRDLPADFTLTSVELMHEFETSETAATQKFADKVVTVSGVITDINPSSVTLFLNAGDPVASVTCSFYAEEAAALAKLTKGDVVSVKGKCTGKLIDVVLNNCSLIPNQ